MSNGNDFIRGSELPRDDINRHTIISLLELMATRRAIVGATAVLVLMALLFFKCVWKNDSKTARKAQQARRMKEVYKSLEKGVVSSDNISIEKANPEDSVLQISQLWIYPIKSLRGCQVPQAMLTKEGFYLDRRFMLMKDHGETPRKLENMAISTFSTMCLFHPSLYGEKLSVQYRSPGKTEVEADTLEISFEPEDLETLEKIEINMHNSPTTGYDMGEKYNSWFSERFGFKVILVFWGGNPRAVLGNLPGRPSNQGPSPRNAATRIAKSLPLFNSLIGDDEAIAFNDCAPFLVISDSSVADVTARLPEDVEMDLTKFRANIVLKGKTSAYEEDFWGELTFKIGGAKIILTGNCGRCQSLNVDYLSGKLGTGKDGKVLKLLQRDRRVDPGMKYSPIFGRYGFVNKRGEGSILSVSDEVVVSKKNKERTRFYWPGLST